MGNVMLGWVTKLFNFGGSGWVHW